MAATVSEESQPGRAFDCHTLSPEVSAAGSLFSALDPEATKEFHILPVPHQDKKQELQSIGMGQRKPPKQ